MAIQPFLTEAPILQGALRPSFSQTFMASFSAASRESILSAPPAIPVLRFTAHAPYLDGTLMLITSVGCCRDWRGDAQLGL